jgi:hypothetical protein
VFWILKSIPAVPVSVFMLKGSYLAEVTNNELLRTYLRRYTYDDIYLRLGTSTVLTTKGYATDLYQCVPVVWEDQQVLG